MGIATPLPTRLRVAVISRAVSQRKWFRQALKLHGIEVIPDAVLQRHFPDRLTAEIADVLLVNLDDYNDTAQQRLSDLINNTELPILYNESLEDAPPPPDGSGVWGKKLAQKLTTLVQSARDVRSSPLAASEPVSRTDPEASLHEASVHSANERFDDPPASDSQESSAVKSEPSVAQVQSANPDRADQQPQPNVPEASTKEGASVVRQNDVASSLADPEAPWSPLQVQASHDDPLVDCLVLIAKLHQRPISAQALTAGLPLDHGRLTPMLCARAAERADLSARVVRRSLKQISNLLLPAILLLKNQQACVLEKILDDGRVLILQPESGKGGVELSLKELKQHYSGNAIFIRPNFRLDARTQSSTIPRANHWFWDTLKQSWRTYAEVGVASILINLFALVTPLFIMNVYDRVVPNNAVETLWVLGIGVIIVFCFDLLMRSLRGYFIDIAGKRTDTILSATLFERVLGGKLSSRPASVGAFASNLQEFDSFRDFFTSASLTALIDLPFIALFLSIIAVLGGSLVWVPLLIIPLALFIGILIQAPLSKNIQDLFRFSSQKNATLIESLVGLETVKSLGAESERQHRWEQAVGSIAKLGLKVRFLSSSAVNITTFLQQLATVIVVILGVYQIDEGLLTVGALVACTILTGRALAPLNQVAATLTRFYQARAAMYAIGKLMDTPLERPSDKNFVHRPTLNGSIEFKNVSFSYPGQVLPALSDISFRLEAGERVAIIGRIGSGKTTIEKLVLGLYEPSEGAIMLDGTDSRQIDPADIRRNVGYVPQDITLFYGTVKDNIILGSPYAEDADVLRAAELAGVTDFINKHPSGFDLQVGEGGEGLSGGQRQSIAVARAVLNDPPILILDEPTNAMDNGTEENLKNRLAQWLQERTLLLVTHRASLLSLVDRVIVVDNGGIVADGPKQQILDDLQQGKVKVS